MRRGTVGTIRLTEMVTDVDALLASTAHLIGADNAALGGGLRRV
jgi:hypothetical protein